jgi:mycothiol synthase
MSYKDFTIRNYRSYDFENYIRLHIDSAAHDQSVSKQLLAEVLGHPSYRPQNDLFIAEQHGNLVGYASVFLEPGLGRALIDGLVHPLHRNNGVAKALSEHALRHAADAGLKVAQICIPESNAVARHLLNQLGFTYIRRFHGFKLDLIKAPLPEIAQDHYTIRQLQPGEVQDLTEIQNSSFAESWGFNPNTTEEILYRINSSSCTAEDVILAYHENRPIGYCWTRLLGKENPKSEGKKGEIHMLGVAPDFRRKGLGRIVLTAGLIHLKGKGVTLVVLTADGKDTAARRLYESAGFEEWTTTKWYEKKLV